MKQRTLQLQHVIWQEGSDYVAQCLNVDVSSFGSTRAEALANLQEALELYFEDQPARRSVRSIARPTLVRQPLRYA